MMILKQIQRVFNRPLSISSRFSKGSSITVHKPEQHKAFKPWKSLYDDVSFKRYFLRAFTAFLIPVGGFTVSMNVFYGPARLEELPTEREPEHYEYYRNPVVRLMAQIVPDPVHEYERDIALRYRSWQKMRLRQLQVKARRLMMQRVDQASWYYVAPNIDPYIRTKYAEDPLRSG